MHSEEEGVQGDLDADFVKRENIKKLKKLMAPGPAVNISDLIAKKIETIEPLVLEIWLSQICAHALILCLFVF